MQFCIAVFVGEECLQTNSGDCLMSRRIGFAEICLLTITHNLTVYRRTYWHRAHKYQLKKRCRRGRILSNATLVFISAYGVRLLWHKITIPLQLQRVALGEGGGDCSNDTEVVSRVRFRVTFVIAAKPFTERFCPASHSGLEERVSKCTSKHKNKARLCRALFLWDKLRYLIQCDAARSMIFLVIPTAFAISPMERSFLSIMHLYRKYLQKHCIVHQCRCIIITV